MYLFHLTLFYPHYCSQLVDFCSSENCGQECSGENCACKSREACAPPLHRRWLCCSCLYVTMYSLCVYSARYSKYLRSFPLDIILSPIFMHQLADQCAAENCGQECSGEDCASKSREAFVLSLPRRWVCCSCLYVTMYSLRVYSARYSNYLCSFSLTLFYLSFLCTTRRKMHG